MNNDLIVLKQLPIIQEQLETVKEQVQKKANSVLELECTDETVKEIKKLRANLRKDFEYFEQRRKEVKSKIMAPYDEFNNIYKSCITNVFEAADTDLKKRIDEVEISKKNEMQEMIENYFLSSCKAKNIDFLNFEMTGIKVLLSSTYPKLMKEVITFLKRVQADLDLIETQEYKNEILVEYKKTLDVSNAITTVSARMKAIAEEKQKQEKIMEQREQAKEVVTKVENAIKKVDSLQAPKETTNIINQEPMLKVSFVVYGTREQLKKLKAFLIDGGYKYE